MSSEVTHAHDPSAGRRERRRHRSSSKLPGWKWALGAVLVPVGLLLGLLLVLLVWGLVEPRVVLTESRERAAIPHLPQAWRDQRIALIADLQIGMWLDNDGMVRRIVDRIREERPAAVLIAGDFIYHPTEDASEGDSRAEARAEVEAVISRAVDLVRPLTEAGIPTYAVLGNHDYAMETKDALALPWVADRLADSLEAVGIHVLRNEAVALEAPPRGATEDGAAEDGALYVAGIGAHWAGRDDVDRTLSQVPPDAARIVLMHNPESFRAIPPYQAPLALAGHTHGGQVRLPWLRHWSWLNLPRAENVHTDGWITGKDFGHVGNRLYVNIGIGFSTLPIRINCAPELTWMTLEAE